MPTMMDIMSRMSESSAIYNQVLIFWKDLRIRCLLDTPEKIKAFTKKSEDLIAENVKTMMSTMLPPQFADLGGSYATLFENMNGTFKSFSNPWPPRIRSSDDRNHQENDGRRQRSLFRLYPLCQRCVYKFLWESVQSCRDRVNREDTEQQAQTLDSYMLDVQLHRTGLSDSENCVKTSEVGLKIGAVRL